MFTNLPKFVFFTGKGGVGKTSLACATSISLVDAGQRVLLVSTDPASNVGQVFETDIGNQITPIGNVPGLDAIEINPEQAAAGYRERIVGPMRGILPPEALRSIEEQLSGACTIEIAAFDEFTALLTDDDLLARYDHVVFDTAPTRSPGWKNNAHAMPQRLTACLTSHRHALSWWQARVSLPLMKWRARQESCPRSALETRRLPSMA
jgi:cellulose biosynthesis protein BcsQ